MRRLSGSFGRMKKRRLVLLLLALLVSGVAYANQAYVVCANVSKSQVLLPDSNARSGGFFSTSQVRVKFALSTTNSTAAIYWAPGTTAIIGGPTGNAAPFSAATPYTDFGAGVYTGPVAVAAHSGTAFVCGTWQ